MNANPEQPLDGLAGLIERVTFHSEESGFAVLRVKVAGRRELVTVVGSLPSVTAGEWVTAQGRWVRDRDHGLQLKADELHCTAPTSREGIEKYLGSGMIKGIGPVYAKKLVEKFGESIFEVIDRQSARLQEVPGIGSGRRRQIKEAWAEQKVIREIMVFLHSNGVGTSRAVRIYKTYGEAAIETVRANPYTLARDIVGIGFGTADRIAEKIGIPRDSLLRAAAGLSHTLLGAMDQGHSALPQAVLLEEATRLLAVDGLMVEEALQRQLVNGEVVAEAIEGERLIFLPALQRAEEAIARTIHRLADLPAALPRFDRQKALAWCEEKSGQTLAPAQRAAIEEIFDKRVVIVTGGPGVGKTTLVRSLLLIARAKRQRCLLCAPTGRAAKRLAETTGLEAKTIHRLLGASLGSEKSSRRKAVRLEADLVVVDEMSMVDLRLMEALLAALPERAHLVLVGDVDQLPSVGPGMVLAHLIESGCVPVVRLTEIFRQAAQSQIITNAHRINQGLAPELPEPGGEGDFFFIEREEPEAITAALLKVVKERAPQKWGVDPTRDIQVLCPMNRGSLGAREINAQLQEALNPRREDRPELEKFGTIFRLGDKVMQLRNNYDKEVFNGDIGQVEAVDLEGREVTITFDGRKVVYDTGELDEVSLAYAVTVHKSQGSEFPVVVMLVATQHFLLLARNLLYTGITRGKRRVVLIGQSKALALAVRNHETAQRHTGLLARLRHP